MADNLQAVRDLFRKADVPLSQNDVWAVQGTPVVKHKALERLAAAMKINFSPPTILRAERDESVILVTGSIQAGTIRSEWSIGEALVNVNYRVTGKMAAYVYAMAEKRAKDRVILKLAELHGVYSEDEADEFKDGAPSSNGNGGGLTMTERLMAAEKALELSAILGMDRLKQAWEALPLDLKPHLVVKKDKLVAGLKVVA